MLKRHRDWRSILHGTFSFLKIPLCLKRNQFNTSELCLRPLFHSYSRTHRTWTVTRGRLQVAQQLTVPPLQPPVAVNTRDVWVRLSIKSISINTFNPFRFAYTKLCICPAAKLMTGLETSFECGRLVCLLVIFRDIHFLNCRGRKNSEAKHHLLIAGPQCSRTHTERKDA